ncbi:uncharacterized protein AKAME5_000864800 [Lates japonicus]|uniref:Uncharacterized protein n=1 Tax=Lates japonicus TaxID=270547 RepID=A0AAD3R562_LATJO|nr:uncharacterized protein AKAME5_000864800 [Lates japonicus]
MKKWLLSGGGFLDEFQEIIERTEIQYLFVAELAWTTARHLCLRLFTAVQQGGHTGGFQMFVSVFCKGETFLPSLHSKLLTMSVTIHRTSGPLSAEETLNLQSTVPLEEEDERTNRDTVVEEGEEREEKRRMDRGDKEEQIRREAAKMDREAVKER